MQIDSLSHANQMRGNGRAPLGTEMLTSLIVQLGLGDRNELGEEAPLAPLSHRPQLQDFKRKTKTPEHPSGWHLLSAAPGAPRHGGS